MEPDVSIILDAMKGIPIVLCNFVRSIELNFFNHNHNFLMKHSGILIIGLIFLSVIAVIAQPSGNNMAKAVPVGVIKGKVLDKNSGEPLPYTNIILYSPRDSSMVTGAIAGDDGSFTIDKVPAGRFYIEVKFMGYEKLVLNNIRINQQNAFLDLGNIRVSPASHQLKEVEVTAERPEVEYKIDRKVVNISENLNTMGSSLARALENTPSITVDIDGNVALRGSTNYQVLIDGKPSPLQGSDALQQIPASAVQNVEIITNPSAKYDPDGLAGIINIITKKRALEGISGLVNLSLGTGNKYRGDGLLTFKNDKFTIYAGANFVDETRYGNMNRSSITYLQDTAKYILSNGTGNRTRHGYTIKGGVTYNLDKSSSLTLEGSTGQHGFKRGEDGNFHQYYVPSLSQLFYTDNSVGSRSENFYNLTTSFDKTFGSPEHKLTAYLFFEHSPGGSGDSQDQIFTDEAYRPINVDPYRISTKEHSNEMELRFHTDYARPIGSKGKLEAGYQTRIDKSNEDYNFLEFDNLNQSWIYNPLFSNAMNFRQDIHSLYSTFTNEFLGFGYMAGLRGEYTYRSVANIKSDHPAIIDRLDIFPTLHVSRKIGKQDQALASYSRRINRPHGWDLDPFLQYEDPNTLRQGNPRLLPEYVDSYEINYQKGLGKSFISLESYYRLTHNGITRVTQVQNDGKRLLTVQNLNREQATGLELMLNFQFTRWFNLNASGNLYQFKLSGVVADTTVSARSTNSNFRFNGSFKITPTTRFQVQGFFQGPSVTAQGERKQFFMTSASVRQDFWHQKLTATLQIRDIFRTAKFQFIAQGADFRDEFKYYHEPQVVMLTLSYRINNYKTKNRQDSENGNMQNEDPSQREE